MKREPAMIAAVTAALALLVGYAVITPEKAELWKGLVIVLIPLAQGVVTRHQVMPVGTLEDAGLQPSQVNEVANDPDRQFKVVPTTYAA